MTVRLTKRKLVAMEEALIARLAGELDGTDGDEPRKDYEDALEWVTQRLAAISSDGE